MRKNPKTKLSKMDEGACSTFGVDMERARARGLCRDDHSRRRLRAWRNSLQPKNFPLLSPKTQAATQFKNNQDDTQRALAPPPTASPAVSSRKISRYSGP